VDRDPLRQTKLELKRKIQMKIAIDPGHGMNNTGNGGFDSGAEAAGFREADIALDYGQQVQKAFQANSISVFMTRADNKEPAPVGQRAARAEQANCTHYIALHLNDSSDPSAHGLEVLFRNPTKDKPLADKLQATLVKVTKFRDRGTQSRPDLAVLKFSNGPAVLIELGFISNTADRTDLLSEAVRDAVCDAIVSQLVPSAAPAPLSVPESLRGTRTGRGRLLEDPDLVDVMAGQRILFKHPVRQRGVGAVQDSLIELGEKIDLGSGDVNRGIFGPQTEAAVESFQGSVGIRVDGQVGSDTIKALDVALAEKRKPRRGRMQASETRGRRRSRRKNNAR
jgi:N-acetylmuramoyl-L-alanine amidase